MNNLGDFSLSVDYDGAQRVSDIQRVVALPYDGNTKLLAKVNDLLSIADRNFGAFNFGSMPSDTQNSSKRIT